MLLTRPFAVAVALAFTLATTLLLRPAPAAAQQTTYTVDPQQSSLTLSAFIATPNNSLFGFVELAPGSLTTRYGGTITGNLAGSTLTFAGGSALTALENPLPPFNPTSPAGVDNYGAFTFASGPSTAENRLFDLVLDLTAGSATHGSPTAATFAYLGSSQAITPFVNANTPYTLTGSQTNSSLSLVQLQTVGLIETLTLPVNLVNIVNGTPSSGTLLYTSLQGTIVATRSIPEPASALVLLTAAGVAAARRRRPTTA